MKTIIGLTGSFGSGCSFIAKDFIAKEGYKYISLSSILREVYEEEHKCRISLSRHQMQDYGNYIRKEKGIDYFAKRAIEKIETEDGEKWIVDSIRNPNEVRYLASESKFFLIAVFADYNIRWERIKSTYDSDERVFKNDDERDGNEDLEYGQRVRDCYEMADIIICNNKNCYPESEDYMLLEAKIKNYVQIIEGVKEFKPSEIEAIMAMAYANSMRSSCLKRKVGAIIVDNYGNIFSSGYNEVPVDQRPCKAEWGKCYRQVLRDEFAKDVDIIIEDPNKQDEIKELFHNKFKILDYCRALHAEENAILNVARWGSSALKGATLYTTTYPCNLCANKIVQVGITGVVYLEPYPMQEAKAILDKHYVKQIPFEGISFNGYFRFKGV